jgi:hypothetical protein
MKQFYALVIFLSLFGKVSAQKYFSQDTAIFIKEFKNYMDASGNEDVKSAASKFKSYWQDQRFPEPLMKRIIRNCNTMIVDPAYHAENEFYSYIEILNLTQKKRKLALPMAKFDLWHNIFESILRSDPRNFAVFLDFSHTLLIDKVLIRSEARRWEFLNTEDYELVYDKQLIVKFKSLELACLTEGDSMVINKTQGAYYPFTRKWIGKGGEISWERCGFEGGSVFAKINAYTIDLGRGEIKLDTVQFTHRGFFAKPLLGSLEHRVSIQNQGEQSIYPRFVSFEKDLFIKNLVKGVDFTGGFEMKGCQIIGSGTDSARGHLDFYNGKVKGAQVYVKSIFFSESALHSNKAAFSLYMRDTLGKVDSIYHPQVDFNYNLKENTLTFMRGNEGITQAPFRDSYHKMEITTDIITWRLDVPKVEMKMINKDAPAKFESGNFFRQEKYDVVQSLLDYNPLEKVCFFTRARAKQNIPNPGTFTLQEYADHLKNKKEHVIAQILLLNDRGFIIYDPLTETIQTQRKTFDYWNANKGLTDYDVIHLESLIKARSNAVLNLVNNDLVVEGCPGIQFSDSQTVYAITTEQQMTIRKNRDMFFAGKVHAGRFDFFGRNFLFNYDGFLIRLDNVDSMRFVCPSRENPEKYVLVKTVLQNIYGTLYIDKENNKSGKKDYPEYPRFVSDRGAMVYYDKPEIYGGVYNRNEYFFKTDPFEINSLDNFKLEDIKLSGLFSSGGIIPDIKDTLTVQKDYSLGFVRATPPEGFAMYGGKGKNIGTISVSNEGFIGQGSLEYLSSIGHSQRYVMFLDSTNGKFEDYTINRTSRVPDVKGTDVWMHWEPKIDKMFVSNTTVPLDMMKGKSEMYGTVILEPNAPLGGYGRLEFDQAKLFSEEFQFDPMAARAEVSNFQIETLDSATISFKGDNVNSKIDFEKRVGDFKANNEGPNTQFPYNKYKCNLNDYHWEIDKKEIDLHPSAQFPEDDAYFESTKHNQDGLRFSAGVAKFDLKTHLLDIDKVPFIPVCDARVIPDKGNVKIEADAFMRELRNSKVVCDSVSEQHTIYNANMMVKGKFKMEGNGDYDYVQGAKRQVIHFDVVSDDQRGRTQAISHILDSTNFFVDDRFRFKGDAKLYSLKPHLQFDGYILPVHDMPIRTGWYRNNQFVNPDSVHLVFSHPVNESKVEVYTGIAYSLDSASVYPIFAGRKRLYADPGIIEVNGALYYDKVYEHFVAGDSAKLYKKSLVGNYMTLNPTTKKIYAEGKLNFAFNMGDVKFSAIGNANLDIGDTPTTRFDMMSLIDFPLPKSALSLMYDSLLEQSERAKPLKYFSVDFKRNLAEMVNNDDKVIEKFNKKLNEDGKFTITDEMEKLFYFTEMNFDWHPVTRKFVGEGDMGLQAINKKTLGKKVYVKVSLEKRKSGDIMHLYIQSHKGGWYYFYYNKGTMGCLSSDKAFNEAIVKDGEKIKAQNLRLRQATPKQKSNFDRDFKTW